MRVYSFPTYTISSVEWTCRVSIFAVLSADVQGVSLFTISIRAGCIFLDLRPMFLNAGMPDCTAHWYRNELNCRCREQSGTGIRGPSPGPECTGTGLRCRMPECRCRWHWSRCRCPAIVRNTVHICTPYKENVKKATHSSKLAPSPIPAANTAGMPTYLMSLKHRMLTPPPFL